ncbi:MAG TPA: DUF1656 domain-containing protein [Advenella sp.]|nr:DUF1656 domain-containing protein [Advenella sp.]
MIGEIDVQGLYVPWLLVLALITFVIAKAISTLLSRLGFYRLVWHPALFDLGLYVILLFAVQRTFPSIMKSLMV